MAESALPYRPARDELHYFGSEHTTWALVRFLARHRMRRHTPIKPHRLHVYEIAIVDSGELHLRIENRQLIVKSRSLGVIPPQHLITHGGAPNAGTVYWLGLDFSPTCVNACDGLVRTAATQIRNILANCGITCFSVTDGLLTAVRNAYREVSVHSPPLSRHAALLNVIGELMQALQASRTHPLEERLLIAPALRLLEEGPPEGLPIEQLARACRMSRTTFNESFKRVIGLSPHAWINRKRIGEAAAALRGTQLPIIRIAGEMGFPSPQHFASVFKAVMGISPTAYRKPIGRTKKTSVRSRTTLPE